MFFVKTWNDDRDKGVNSLFHDIRYVGKVQCIESKYTRKYFGINGVSFVLFQEAKERQEVKKDRERSI